MIFITAFYVLFVIRELVAIEAQLSGPNSKCEIQCSTIRDLESRISFLERSVAANDKKLVEFVSLQHSFQRMEGRVSNHVKEIGKLKKTVPQQTQNLTTLFQKVKEMEVEKFDVLRTSIEKLQENFQEHKFISNSLKTQLDEINGNSSSERRRTAEALKVMSDKMVTESINHNISLASFKQEMASVKSTIEPLNSSINRLYEVQSAFNQTLSANQQNIDDLKGNFLNITDTLTIYQQNFTNLGTELQRSFTIGQQQLYENLTAQLEMQKHYFDNATAGVFSKLNELANEMNILRMNFSNLSRDTTTLLSIKEPLSTEIYNYSSFMKRGNDNDMSPYKSGNENNGCLLPRGEVFYIYVATITPTGLQPLNYSLKLIPNETKLRFGCYPSGKSVLIDPESKESLRRNYTLECINGTWKGGNFPDCQLQMSESTIRDIANVLSDQFRGAKSCFLSEQNFTVTEYNCSKYVLCSEGRLELHECLRPLVFNLATGYCQSPSNVDCPQQENGFKLYGINYLYNHPNVDYNEAQINLLSEMVPIITLDPNRRYEPNSLMANGATGELVIYPQSNVTLNCLFPIPSQSTGAGLSWIINYFQPSPSEKRPESSGSSSSSLKLALLLTESDSGIYTCVGPNGRRNDFEIIVRAITCPSLKQFVPGITIVTDYEPYENATSVPMTTEVTYRCQAGHEYSKSEKVLCTVYGYWSKEFNEDPVNQLDICKKSIYVGEEEIGSTG